MKAMRLPIPVERPAINVRLNAKRIFPASMSLVPYLNPVKLYRRFNVTIHLRKEGNYFSPEKIKMPDLILNPAFLAQAFITDAPTL